MIARFRLSALPGLLAGLALGLVLGLAAWADGVAAQTAPPKRAAKADTLTITPGQQRIALTVNDEAITVRDIEQRARFTGLSTNLTEQVKEKMQGIIQADSTQQTWRKIQEQVIAANPGKSKEEIMAILQERQKQLGMALQKKAIDSVRAAMMPKLTQLAKNELIDERLKLQEAKKHGLEIPDAEVKQMLSEIAQRNKMTYEGFAKHLAGMDIDIATMGERMRANKAWRAFVVRRYGAQASVTQREVDLFLAAAAAEHGVDTIELQLQRISLTLGGRTDQTTWTRRYAEAEGLRKRFSGCKSMGDLAATAEAKHVDMKFVKPSSIAEPMRSMLLSAKDNEVLPPVATDAGVDLYAVCGRRSAGGQSQQEQAKQHLQAKQLEIFAERHLRNLKQEANIEYK